MNNIFPFIILFWSLTSDVERFFTLGHMAYFGLELKPDEEAFLPVFPQAYQEHGGRSPLSDLYMDGEQLELWKLNEQNYQAETTRCGAKLVKTELVVEKDWPIITIVDNKDGWKVLDGEAWTGMNAREYYFTLEAPGKNRTPPKVEIRWPGVQIERVLPLSGAVSKIADGIAFQMTGQRAPTAITTGLVYGAVRMVIFHNWEVRRAGHYREGPWPSGAIQSQLNFLFAAREMCRYMGYTSSDNPGFNGDIRLYGFETNFPNGHVDHPPHFHIMLGWPGWTGTKAGHFLLDEKGIISKNVVSHVDQRDNEGNLISDTFGPGDVCPMYDPDGQLGFELIITPDGKGVVMRRAKGQPEFRISSDNSATGAIGSVEVSKRENDGQTWIPLCSVRAEDDPAKGYLNVMVTDNLGQIKTETFIYDIDTG
jgi:hypothetical protein